jgi:hypothetical protein
MQEPVVDRALDAAYLAERPLVSVVRKVEIDRAAVPNLLLLPLAKKLKTFIIKTVV